MNYRIISLIIIVFIFVNNETCYSQNSENWTSSDPLSIPLDIRKEVFNQGNLIPNPSFESVHIADDGSVDVQHWSITGDKVDLVDVSEESYGKDDVSHGKHAIRIERTKKEINEVNNKSHGIESEFIEVIPANYDLFFDIKLKEIIPYDYPNDRFQRRVGKDIDIRLKFYDKNKNEIYSGTYFEYLSRDIDNSFKGFQFSNYFFIEKFDWGRVRGATWHYPFSDGDLPDGTRYVKLFLGLKGSGTMWVDNIDFRMSKWNFTPVERMQNMFEQDYDLTDLIIPTPKSIDNKSLLPIESNAVYIVDQTTGGLESEVRKATLLIQEKFTDINNSNLNVSIVDNAVENSEGIQIILTDDLQLLTSNFPDAMQFIQGEDQGYLIRRKGNRIYLGANQEKGLYYAAATFSQIINSTESVIEYADITDYPDFKGRSTRLLNYNNNWTLRRDTSLSEADVQEKIQERDNKLDKQIDDLDFYVFYKINDFYNSYFSLSNRWWKPGDFYREYYSRIGDKISEYGSIPTLAVQINPYFHIDMEVPEESLTDSLRQIFSHSTDDGFNKVTNILRTALDAGARTVMLAADDYVPHSGIIRGEYTLFTDQDKARFTNLANAHAYFVNKLKGWLDQEYGDIRFEFVPPAYNNWFIDYGRGISEIYFRDLGRHLDESIIYIWTGNVIRSLTYDIADIDRIIDVYKRKPMVWDNSPYARTVESENGGYPVNYPKKAVMNNLFQPFDIQYPENFSTLVDSRYYSNHRGTGEINKIQYLTFADFSWNTSDYDPEFSLFKALAQYVGIENGKLLMQYSDSFYRFVSIWGEVRNKKKDNSNYVCSNRDIQIAENRIMEMNRRFNSLELIENQDLLQEIETDKNNKINSFNDICEI